MTTFTSEDLVNAIANSKLVEDAPYHPGYEDAAMNPNESGRPLSVVIRERMIADKKRFWAGDNISDYVSEKDKEQLNNEATKAFLISNHALANHHAQWTTCWVWIHCGIFIARMIWCFFYQFRIGYCVC